MKDKYKEIWIHALPDKGCICKATLNLVAKARDLIKNKPGWRLCAFMFGADINDAAKDLSAYVDHVYAFCTRDFTPRDHMRFTYELVPLLKEKQPEIMLFSVSNFNSVFAATLGMRLRTGVIAHAVNVRIDNDDHLIATIPAFGGQYMGDILCPRHKPQIASLRVPDILPSELPQLGEISLIFSSTKEVPYKYCGLIQTENETCSIENAEIIVCGGLGIGSKENWAVLKEVAALLGGAAACTRPPIDEGWGIDERIMIGTSGKYVSPKVYIGFGVSGSSHHVCGMCDSGKIININIDKNSYSLSLSDYAVVGDAQEYLLALKEKLREIQKAQTL